MTSSALEAGLTAAELQDSVTTTLENDGSEVDSVTCPATARVAPGVVTPCQAEMDGERWSVIVIFAETTGRYQLLIS